MLRASGCARDGPDSRARDIYCIARSARRGRRRGRGGTRATRARSVARSVAARGQFYRFNPGGLIRLIVDTLLPGVLGSS